MAKFTKTMSGDSRYSIELEVKETSTSGNESVVSYTLKAIKSSGSGFYTSNSNNPVKVTLDGEDVVDKKVSYDFRNKTSITLASGTKPIQHNPDGTKTLTCKGYFKDANNSLGNATASGNLELTPLHTPPSARISGCSELQTALSSFVQNVGYKVVDNISVKQVTLTPTLYDDASVSNYNVSSGEVSVTSSTSPLYMNFINKIANVSYQITTTDDMGGVGTNMNYWGTRIHYTKPTIVSSNFTAKRKGQLTGNVELIANGTYYYNQGAFTQNIAPTIKYSVRIKGTSTYLIQDQPATITTNNGNWSMQFTINSIFNSDTAYEVILTATDNLIEAVNSNLPSIGGTQVSAVTKVSVTKDVPIGEPTWAEYKDHVDFKKLTINKKYIVAPYTLFSSTATTGNVALSDNASNYSYIEIYYYCSSGTHYSSVKIDAPNNKNVQLKGENDDGSFNYMYCAYYTISGSTITRNKEIRWRLAGSGSSNRSTSTTEIKVYKVIGYK